MHFSLSTGILSSFFFMHACMHFSLPTGILLFFYDVGRKHRVIDSSSWPCGHPRLGTNDLDVSLPKWFHLHMLASRPWCILCLPSYLTPELTMLIGTTREVISALLVHCPSCMMRWEPVVLREFATSSHGYQLLLLLAHETYDIQLPLAINSHQVGGEVFVLVGRPPPRFRRTCSNNVSHDFASKVGNFFPSTDLFPHSSSQLLASILDSGCWRRWPSTDHATI